MAAADGGADLLGVAEASRMAGGESLARTPELLPVLAEAGVVDAGGCGFLLLLDAVPLRPSTDVPFPNRSRWRRHCRSTTVPTTMAVNPGSVRNTR
ncbi:MAG: hypothetical protein CM1200mP26_08420 [Acidimicrobiales bacterium]|nr:MAG: hypothetical protein CM1200mP26_08420 [Acidimicrobiales bacterium]